jgi:site-specific recombinase XerC
MVRNEPENRTVVDIYDVERRLQSVSSRIRESKEITDRNKHLIFEFADNCLLRGLSKLRAVFYLNRFCNIARLADKDFDRMARKDIEELVRKIQTKGVTPRTASDHLTAIKTFCKWLENTGDTYPEKVRWIKPSRRSAARLLRKKGVGVMLVSQKISDFDPAMRSAMNVSIVFRTKYDGDLKAAARMLESQVSEVIPKLPVGYSVFHFADVGDPFVLAWRPTYSQA